MRADIYPLQVLLAGLAGWLNRHQQDVIVYLVEENRVLKEQLKGKRLRLTDGQRRRLESKAKRHVSLGTGNVAVRQACETGAPEFSDRVPS